MHPGKRRLLFWVLAGCLAAALALLLLLFLPLPLSWVRRGAAPAGAFRDGARELGLSAFLAAGSKEKLLIFENLGSGAALLDFDRDGLLDVALASGGEVRGGKVIPRQGLFLYRQLPGGRFEEVSARLGIRLEAWGTGIAVGDIDNDGDLDLFVGTLEAPRLYRNDGDRGFTEIAREAGIEAARFASSSVFLDYDRDGLLDLYVARYVEIDLAHPPNEGGPCFENGIAISCGPTMHPPLRHVLFHNRGGGRFEDATERAGLSRQPGSFGLGAASGDLDGDGWPDLYAANDTAANFLLRNRGDGTFEEVALEAGCALSESAQGQSGMGVDLADADGDGRLEIFVSNYAEEYNSYYRNLGNLSFVDRSHGSGLEEGSFLTLGWGAKFIDYDQDGALDLFVVNGHVHPRARELKPFLSYEEPILFYRGDGSGRFHLETSGLGADAVLPRSHRAAAVGDVDGDGDLDLLVSVLDGPPVLLLNQLGTGGIGERRSIILRLVGTRSNREGIGARVELEAGGKTQLREITRGGSYLSASDAAAHFGMGGRSIADRARIRWPSGTADTLEKLETGFTYRIEEGGKILEKIPHR